jgi:hypothetical protein
MKKKRTRREELLAKMERIVQWARWIAVIEPCTRRAGAWAACPSAWRRSALWWPTLTIDCHSARSASGNPVPHRPVETVADPHEALASIRPKTRRLAAGQIRPLPTSPNNIRVRSASADRLPDRFGRRPLTFLPVASVRFQVR